MTTISRRDFAKLAGLSGTAAFFPKELFARREVSLGELGVSRAPLRRTPAEPDEKFWQDVRARFLIPRDVAFLNTANLAPMSLPVIEAIEKNIRAYELGPTPAVRDGLMENREIARRELATALRVTPEEIVLTRNTTEGNNFVSSGLKLGAGDEVIVSSDNHPSNLRAWQQKGARFGFTVVAVAPPPAHPGSAKYVESFVNAFTPRTRVLAVTHVSSNSGDLLPVNDLCRVARERGVLSLVDGAQAFGVLDLDLSVMKPDFYTGSMHKWPCGPKEKGVFYVNAAVQDRISPSVYGVYGGKVGISRTFEAEGQRDDASIAAVVEALRFQGTIGRAVIEQRSRALAQHLITGLKNVDGVQLYTDPAPDRSVAIVIFKPGNLDPHKLGDALTNERIITTVRAGQDKPGLRAAMHFYNTMEDVDRLLGSVRRYMKAGLG
ncbi:MAG TPA: aminotransferase class V-fold PLP-dependent enzyme [Gemmatimonadaceae bacterium]|nr:aminotransferase class V-fold PLP-dependent enzyme [Gemmatimonadaceae bacterium]